MNWFTSDLHFGHAHVLTYCRRPFSSLDKMHEELIARWNACVKSTDTIYVVGDLALCPFKQFETLSARLQGRKILVQGNHDSYSLSQYEKLGFQVFTEIKMKLAGSIVRLSHYPYALHWWKRPFAFESELRYMDRRPPRIKNEILIHGHSHVNDRVSSDGDIHVGVDAWDFRPVASDEIESLIARMKK